MPAQMLDSLLCSQDIAMTNQHTILHSCIPPACVKLASFCGIGLAGCTAESEGTLPGRSPSCIILVASSREVKSESAST